METLTPRLELRVLGPLEAAVHGRPVALGGPQPQGVLAQLAAVPGRTVGVWALVDELWGARPPKGAHRTVRTYVSRLRAALRHTGGADAAAVLVTRPPGYQLRMDPSAVDAVRFERLVASGQQMLATRPWQAFELLSTALGLWRGDAFAEFRHLPAIAARSTQLEQLRLSATETRIEAALVLGLDAQAAVELEGLVLAHPTRELLWGQLMIAFYRLGRQADALAAFRTARALLMDEHGVEPSPALAGVHRRILQHDADLNHDWRAPSPRSALDGLSVDC
ncbi:AfsR/SARP family transcriptional regulator [Streptomyces turgidiscabies]|uniref:DNA-binding SARP family transcriptional activator n=1 Tax=Streptomyces turgidiscabies TaxID=85558 RepID=A0ABU0RML5_9ACTN|nr:AfsR/SARP family transcriptional regulator [Streptomyces turgidiscabies]MDQ0933209.1 DNA-binding SARP family transcriptional activator [Streptomyces turgidiscabies]